MTYQSKYLKYKTKYLQLRNNQIGGNEVFCIVETPLGTYMFTAKGRFTIDDYDYVHVSSSIPTRSTGAHGHRIIDENSDQNMLFYRSKSEIGIWRLANKPGLLMAKGTDYVTSTFVNIDLQICINSNINDILSYNEAQIAEVSKLLLSSEVNRIISDYKRCIDDIYLQFISFCSAGNCFNRRAYSDIMRSMTRIDETKEYEKFFKESFTNNETIYGRSKPENFMILMFTTISQYMQKYYEIIGVSQVLGSYTVKSFTDFTVSLYKIPIHRRDTRDGDYVYDLIYAQYDYNGAAYRYIVNLIPQNTLINSYGIYDKITCAGVYIYKPFEYVDQLATTRDTEVVPGTAYAFIGKYLTNIWPLNEIST